MNPAETMKKAEGLQPKRASVGFTNGEAQGPWRLITAAGYTGVLLLAFAPTLFALVVYAAGSDLHSHILLIPFISLYLVYIQRDRLPKHYFSSAGWGLVAALVGLAAVGAARIAVKAVQPWSENDYLALMTFGFLCLLVAGGFFFLGRKWLAAVAFPVSFLVFMIPMPDAMADALETASQYASADAANLFLGISGTPFFRDGLVFQLANITLRVAQECSGVRSSWVLFITSVLTSHMFLKTPWRRAILVGLVIPLGILRNGFRIMVIGLLCVKFGPQMVDSVIHRRGGPLFFALSLVPLFLLLWWFRRGERKSARVAAA